MSVPRRRTAREARESVTPRQNGTDGRSEDAGDDDQMEQDLGEASGTQEDKDDNPAQRRRLRHQYRELITSVQQNREDMLSPTNNKLTEVLEEANKLFVNVRQAREAALDAQFLVLATDLGREKANQLRADGSAFDPSTYVEHLVQLTFMGINRLEETDDSDEESPSGGYLPEDAWHRLAKAAESCFKRAPTFHFMLGSFLAEPPPPRPRVERQRKASNKELKRSMPTQLKKMEESQQEATEKEVERILGFLHDSEESDPISYYEFVVDPHSFSRTVENIFHVSFLIRDGLAKIYLDEDKLPCIAPVPIEEAEGGGTATRQQCVTSISPKTWQEIIEAYDIKQPMIRSRASDDTAASQ